MKKLRDISVLDGRHPEIGGAKMASIISQEWRAESEHWVTTGPNVFILGVTENQQDIDSAKRLTFV